MRRVIIMAVAATLACGTSALAGGFDSFDSYISPTNLIGSGNGQVSYIDTAPTGSPMGDATLTALTDGTAQSAPNVAEFADGAGSTTPSARFRLESGSAIDTSAAGSNAVISFDWKTTGGPGGRVSQSWKPLWSVDASAAAEDNIGNEHAAGIADNGQWFLDNGNINSTTISGDPRYQTNNWYRTILSINRPSGSAGGYDYTMELIDIDGGNVSLGALSRTGANAAGRNWLTGLGFLSSSNPNEVILIDNFRAFVPEPTSGLLLVLGGLGLSAVRRKI